jgi:hypothetical protein
MTELLAANPKAKDRALARKAIEQLGPSPLAEGTLRKQFGALRHDGKLPPLETAEEIEERKIRDYFKAQNAEREQNERELALKLREASALGLDLDALNLEAVGELAENLRLRVFQLEVGLTSWFFLAGASSDTEAIAKRRIWKENLSELKKQLALVQEICGYRQRLGGPK